MKVRVHVTENLSLVHNLLSLVEPGYRTVVITTDSPSNRQFFKDFLRAECLFVQPMMFWGNVDPPPDSWRRGLETIRGLRQRIRDLVARLPQDAEVYWYHVMGPVILFSFLGEMLARGMSVRFVTSPLLDIYHISHATSEGLSPAYQQFLREAGDAMGLEVARVQSGPRNDTWVYAAIGPAIQHFHQQVAVPEGWEPLQERYFDAVARLFAPRDPDKKGRLLFIDDHYPKSLGFDEVKAREAALRLFTHLLTEGYEVYIKGHYHSDQNRTSLPPYLAEQVRVLPNYLPAELYVPHADVVAFSGSSTSRATARLKMCLLPVLPFELEWRRQWFWNLVRGYVLSEWDQVVFLQENSSGGFERCFPPSTGLVPYPVPSIKA